MRSKLNNLIIILLLILGCESEKIVQYFEYPDHNVLNIGSKLTDFIMTNDSNTLIAADKGNNRVLFIDVSTDDMSIVKSIWVGSEPTSLETADNGQYLLVGLRGASSVSVVSIDSMSLLGTIVLDEDSVYDIEYIDGTNQLVVSFVSSNPAYNLTKIYQWSGSPWNADFSVELVVPNSSVNYAGPISSSDDGSNIFILDKYNGPPYRVYRYDITNEGLKNKVNSSNIADGPISLHDLEYVPNFGLVAALAGSDFIDGTPLDHAPVFSLDNLSHIANLDVGSTPLALAYDSIGEHVYISPTDVDDNGMFIIEYNLQTQLQTNYYQVAGLLGSHALIVDYKGEYIYAAVDDLSDQDTDEPYNNSSFNIQRIKILPEGTFSAINNFE